MPSPRLLTTLAVAAAFAAIVAPASGHPGHDGHAGMPGATSIVDVPFPPMGRAAGGFASPNVEFVKNFPQHVDTAGARKLGNFFYITTERDLTIYDVSDPPNPVEVGKLVLPDPGMPVFTEEDPDTNGRILLVSNNGVLTVIDVRDKKAPKVLSSLPGADEHTVTCVLDCTWAYGSDGMIVDLRDPANPRLSDKSWQTDDIESDHDVTEVEPGIVLTSTQPLKLLDARTNPEGPTELASTPKEPGRFVHANLWPGGGTDDFLLVGGEAQGPGCSRDVSASFSTWDARAFRETGATRQLDEFRLEPGAPEEGRAPESTYCVHWFDPHPNYRSGGLIAIGWYEHGTHFLRVGEDGRISEVGFFLGGGGQASAAYWIDERTVYVADYLRGLDVLRFTGDISGPPAKAAGGQGAEPEPAPADPAPSRPATEPPAAQAAASPACTQPVALRSASVTSKGGRLELGFRRAAQAPVTVDVFQQSVGRRVIGERLVARFSRRTSAVRWDGKANRPGRTITDGYYFVRYRSGGETRRVALRRVDGRWSRRPSFQRPATCDLVRSFKLERPVFGGRTNRALGVSYQVAREAQVTVTVLRGSRTVRRFATRTVDARRTVRLRFDAERRSRGDYRVRIDVRRAGERVASTTVSRRL
jgi:hypothetical protein